MAACAVCATPATLKTRPHAIAAAMKDPDQPVSCHESPVWSSTSSGAIGVTGGTVTGSFGRGATCSRGIAIAAGWIASTTKAPDRRVAEAPARSRLVFQRCRSPGCRFRGRWLGRDGLASLICGRDCHRRRLECRLLDDGTRRGGSAERSATRPLRRSRRMRALPRPRREGARALRGARRAFPARAHAAGADDSIAVISRATSSMCRSKFTRRPFRDRRARRRAAVLRRHAISLCRRGFRGGGQSRRTNTRRWPKATAHP